MAFLRTCTEPAAPAEYSFQVNEVPDLRRDPRFNHQLRRRFGDYASIGAERVDEALDYLDEIDPQPANRWGMAPVWFTARSALRILDPSTGRPLPGQDPVRFHGVEYEWGVPLGTSRLRLILNNHALIAIELCVPDATDDLLLSVVPWLQKHLPFKLSSKQWRAWTPTKSGSFKGRRMTAPRT